MRFVTILIVSSLFMSCSKNSITENQQRYNIQLIDGFTESPLANVQLALYYTLGGTYIMDIAQGVTDQNGEATVYTMVDRDSVQTLLEQSEWLDEDQVFQIISIDKEGYLLYELFQDTSLSIIRPRLHEDELIIAKAYEYIPATLQMIDETPKRNKDIVLEYSIKQFHPKFYFQDYGSSLQVFQKEGLDTMSLLVYLAHESEYRVDYHLSVVDTMTESLDTIFSSFVEFEADENIPSPVYQIKF